VILEAALFLSSGFHFSLLILHHNSATKKKKLPPTYAGGNTRQKPRQPFSQTSSFPPNALGEIFDTWVFLVFMQHECLYNVYE
jgi:hypothetical protein